MQTSYDAHNRPEMISEGGRITRYGYDLAGRAVALVAGNGQTSSNTYDALGRLVDRTLFRTTGMSQSEVLAEFSWQHDLLGNVTQQLETWPGDATRAAGIRTTGMTYDGYNRLSTETITEPGGAVTATTYGYDLANNRTSKTVTGGTDPGVWSYTYNSANQLTSWSQSSAGGTLLKNASLGYDSDGNRTSQTITGSAGAGINPPLAASGTTRYAWDSQGRLSSVTMPDGITQYAYDYDYRTRRIGTHKMVSGVEQTQTTIVFAGGLSLAEYENTAGAMSSTPTVEYTRGPDMGGGVGGMLYSIRGREAGPSASVIKYSLSNGRGDIVAQSDSSAALTWTASYEAYGRRTAETGNNVDKQRGNSKDEDPTGLLNEGQRYRDLETGVWTARDPAGFVDGPNLYAYVRQNPWTAFDPHGLEAKVKTTPNQRGGTDTVITVTGVIHYTGKQKEFLVNDANGKTKVLNKEQYLTFMKSKLESDVRRMWDGGDGVNSWKVDLQIRIVKSAKEISETDHVFNLTNGIFPLPGYAKNGGSIINVNPLMAEKPNDHHAAHELGHSLGLRHLHPDDVRNGKFGNQPFTEGVDIDNNVKGLKETNFMGYSDDEKTPVEHSQIKEVQRRYEDKLNPLNNYGDKNLPDPYYERKYFKEEVK